MNPREEIKDIAPNLSQWKLSEGYSVPTDYFGSLNESIIERVDESEKLESYFTSLPDQVMQKIKQEEKSKVVSLGSYFKYGVAAALLLAVGSMIYSNLLEEAVLPSYSMIETSEDFNYIIDEISLEDIFDSEFIDDESLEELLVSGEDEFSADDLAEEFIFDADDETLEEFL